ncbi:MAG: XdhC family protein [Bdellovibrionales bacterium]|nr:XdhC family protein [Bdellovibrionales bacterium]
MPSFETFCERFLELKRAGTPMVVVTLTGERGHVPQDLGARMVVGDDGILFGTIGGGKIEKRCIEQAQEYLSAKDGPTKYSFTWNLQRDIGMSCGGELSVLFEVFSGNREWRIALFGAGHIVQELAPLLLKLECRLQVFDPRIEWLSRISDHPRLEKRLTPDMVPMIDELSPDCFVGIITMGHATDYPLVKRALETRTFPYLGVIGSKVKRIKINSDLLAAGIPGARVDSFHCPMGEDYGKNDPAEIAISIASQMLSIRRDLGLQESRTGGGGSSLRQDER